MSLIHPFYVMCDGKTQFHFNFVEKRVFVFCGSNHLRFEKTTTSPENCFLHTSLAADLPLDSIGNLCGGEFLITQGNWHNSKIHRKPYSYQLPAYWNFFIFGLNGSRILDHFFFSEFFSAKSSYCRSRKIRKIWKNVNKVEPHTYPSPDPKLTQAGYQLTVVGVGGGVGAKFLRSRLTLIRSMNGKIKYKCE